MISKRSIKQRIKRKTNPAVAATISLALKNKSWMPLAQKLSGSTRNHSAVPLFAIDKNTSNGETVIIPGKVLSSGELTKKVRICALSFSSAAKEKMKATKSEAVSIIEEIQKNPKAQGVKILS